MIYGVEDVDGKRRDKLISLLDIDLDWRLNKVSDGQRRRVQICMGLLKPYKVKDVFIVLLHFPILSYIMTLHSRVHKHISSHVHFAKIAK